MVAWVRKWENTSFPDCFFFFFFAEEISVVSDVLSTNEVNNQLNQIKDRICSLRW